MSVRAFIAASAALIGGVGCDLHRPACRPEALGAIEAQYFAEAFAACVGYTIEDCPELPRIEHRHAALREEWARCQ